MMLITIYRGLVCYFGMLINGLIGCVLYYLSLGKLWRFNMEVLSPIACRCMLFLIGIKVDLSSMKKLPNEKVIYIFNHNSYLDVFIFPLLGLKNTRIVISEGTKHIVPLYLCNLSQGALFIPLKKERARRINFFKKLVKFLKEEDASLIMSPEGVHLFKHYIAPFNKGLFHVATETKTSLCPLYFSIPEASNPFQGHTFKSGTIKIETLPLIHTNHWQMADLVANTKLVRDIYVEKFNLDFGTNII